MLLSSRIVYNIPNNLQHFQRTPQTQGAEATQGCKSNLLSIAENKIDWACNGDWLDHATTVNQSDLTEFEDMQIVS